MDEKALARRCNNMSVPKFRAAWKEICGKFEEVDGRYLNLKMEATRKDANEAKAVRSGSATLAASARWAQENDAKRMRDASETQCDSDADAMRKNARREENKNKNSSSYLQNAGAQIQTSTDDRKTAAFWATLLGKTGLIPELEVMDEANALVDFYQDLNWVTTQGRNVLQDPEGFAAKWSRSYVAKKSKHREGRNGYSPPVPEVDLSEVRGVSELEEAC